MDYTAFCPRAVISQSSPASKIPLFRRFPEGLRTEYVRIAPNQPCQTFLTLYQVFYKKLKNVSYRYYCIDTLMNVVSLCIFTFESVLECPVLGRLSRAPRDRQRPRERATPPQQSSPRGRRRKNGPQHQTRRSESGERRKEASPVPDMAGDRENMEKPWKSTRRCNIDNN